MCNFLWLQPNSFDGKVASIHLEEELPSLLGFIVVVKLDREDTVLTQRACVDIDQR